MNPRMMKQAMKRMGIQQSEIEAIEVIIRCEDKDIIISDPQVSKVNMMGQSTYQIAGVEHVQERDSTPSISEDDVATVMDQAGVDKETARKAIEDADGDLASAIMNLSQE